MKHVLQGVAMALLAVAVAMVTACPPSQGYNSTTGTTSGLNPIKCPDHDDAAAVLGHGDSTQQNQYQIVKSAHEFAKGALVPELNDCQRLIVRDDANAAPRFGPLAMLFSADSLEQILADVEPGSGTPRRAAAAIYLEGENYDTLGLKKGWNCLYLFPRAGGDVDALMVPRDNAAVCNRPPMPGEPATKLRVMVRSDPKADLPSVGRWADDFQGGKGTHHIWLRCGDFACDVGVLKGMQPLTVMSADVRQKFRDQFASNPYAERVVSTHGWYDDQILALPTQGARPKVGPTRGYLVPAPELDDLAAKPTEFDRWTTVAYIYLDQDIPQYQEKLNLYAGVNTLKLKRTALAEGETLVRSCTDPAGSDRWYMQVIPADQSKPPKYYCAPHFAHDPQLHFPGVVRWRWLDTDETTWVRCPAGCCAVQ